MESEQLEKEEVAQVARVGGRSHLLQDLRQLLLILESTRLDLLNRILSLLRSLQHLIRRPAARCEDAPHRRAHDTILGNTVLSGCVLGGLALVLVIVFREPRGLSDHRLRCEAEIVRQRVHASFNALLLLYVQLCSVWHRWRRANLDEVGT